MATEKRLIDANELKKFPIRIDHYDKVNGNEHFVLGIESVLEYAENLPTVDAVEVVRCKDCKHYDNSEGICWCELNSKFYPGGLDWHCFPEDGFCSYGERRTDD